MSIDFVSPSTRAAGSDLTIAISPLGLVELSDEEFEMHGARLNRYAQSWAFYLGHHWAYHREAGEPQITFNYVRALSDWLTNFTFSNGITFESDEAYQHIIPALLDRIWAKDNDKLQTLWTIGNAGSVQGDSFVKVAYDPAYVDPAGNPHPGRVRLLPLNASFCFPSLHPHDRERLVRFKLKYRFWGCLDSQTEVLTNNGWKKYEELNTTDDLILTRNTSTDNIEWQKINKLNIVEDYPGHLVLWDTVGAVSTPNHRWLVEEQKGRNETLRYERSIARTEFGMDDDKSVLNLRNSSNVILGGGIPSEFAADKKYSDELIETAAWYITEGLDQYNQTGFHTIRISQSIRTNPSKVLDIRRLMTYWQNLDCTFNEWKQRSDGVIEWYLGKGINSILEEVAPGKQITPEFLCSLTYSQAKLFRRVLLEGDGHTDAKHGTRWTQLNEKRRDGYQMLCAMLGIRTNVHTDRVAELSKNVVNAATIKKYHQRIYTDGIVWCPEVDNGIILARRNKKTFWTGNSTIEGTRQVHTYIEILDDEWIEEYVDDELIDRRKNPLGFIPVVHIANKVASASPWGLSDVIDVIPLNRDFNEKATEISDIINYSTAPVTIITGASAANLEKSANKIWSLRQKDATVQNLSSDFSTLGPAVDFLQMLKLGMHEMIGIPEAALGTAQAVSNTSGVALSIQYMPTIHAYKQKKIQYEKGIREISEMALKTLFLFEPEQLIYNPDTDGIMQEPSQMPVLDANDPAIYDISVKWPPPLPVDKTIKLTEIQAMQALGLESNIGALRELGVEFPDEKFQEIFTEKVDDMEQEAALQIRRAIVAAYVQKLTGLVPEGYTEQDDKPKEGEPGKPPTAMDNTSTNGILPSMPTISDVTGISNTNMLSNITAQAFGTKLPQQSLRKNQSQDD
jgi:hypothetical protein